MSKYALKLAISIAHGTNRPFNAVVISTLALNTKVAATSSRQRVLIVEAHLDLLAQDHIGHLEVSCGPAWQVNMQQAIDRLPVLVEYQHISEVPLSCIVHNFLHRQPLRPAAVVRYGPDRKTASLACLDSAQSLHCRQTLPHLSLVIVRIGQNFHEVCEKLEHALCRSAAGGHQKLGGLLLVEVACAAQQQLSLSASQAVPSVAGQDSQRPAFC